MHTHRALVPLLLFFFAPSAGQPAAAAPPAPAFADVRIFADTYCTKCHGEKMQKGGLNLEPFKNEKSILKQRKAWRAVAEQLTAGEMPPAASKQPSKDERDRIVKWINSTLDAADAADRARPDPGRPIVRRLTAGEYNRTVCDLLGVDFDAAGAVGMPDDTVGESFDNLAAALNISDTLTEKYFAAANLIIEKLYAFPQKGPKPKPDTLPPLLAKVVKPGDAKGTAVELARRAYRRPATEKEVDRLLALYEKATKEGAKFEDALKPVFKAVLVSPNFLLRIERDRPKEENAYLVNDHELATRLSYFLWASMPDAELFALADKGELGKPAVFESQVKRMLADPKAKALTDTFAEQWLQLKKLPRARPSTEFFPTFTPKLRQAMGDEVRTFFDHLRTDDRPITDLLDADYTYVNADLASHYGMADVTGPEFRRVKLTDPNRGGLLGMAAVLSLTSHTNRTSPTLRGKYVLDIVLGTPPPPPPPGVSQIDESKAPKELKTFRDKLAAHATRPECAGCHAKIDPLGFGLENFDAIGRLRKSGPEVNARGMLSGGESFDGPEQLKKVLLKRKPRFVENVTEKLLVFALGRELQSVDAATVKAITAELEKNDYRFTVLVTGIAKSFPFRHRRNPREDDGEEP
jgi:mono/diheme cytochrome c family protein